MLDPPNLPVRPFKPYRLMLCGIGILAGLVLGGSFALAPEILSGTLYTEREIRKVVPFEIIAEIPALETPAEQAWEKRQQVLAGVAASLIVVCILAGTAVTYFRG